MTRLSPEAKRRMAAYLAGYAEAEATLILPQPERLRRRYVLVLPLFNEGAECVLRVAHHPDAAQTLLILVLNEPDTQRHHPGNRAFLDVMASQWHTEWRDGTLSLHRLGPLQIVLISRLGDAALPSRKGVGLARKIGADLACNLITQDVIDTPWVFFSDADARIPAGYFDLPTDTRSANACVYAFHHLCDDSATGSATALYEGMILYYQQQLRRAGSPYAYQSLGSCMAVRAEAYCLARGFPPRAAGEDFYLLNKLAKLPPASGHTGSPIYEFRDCTVQIEARESDRVPFGTGPAVIRLKRLIEEGTTPKYYDPALFDCLGSVLHSVPTLWLLRAQPGDYLATLPNPAANMLRDVGLEAFLRARAGQDKNEAAFTRHFHHWFDAFRTLKAVHYLQANGFPDVPVTALSLPSSILGPVDTNFIRSAGVCISRLQGALSGGLAS